MVFIYIILGFLLGYFFKKYQAKLFSYIKFFYMYLRHYKVIKSSVNYNEFLENDFSRADYEDLGGLINDK